MTDAAGIRMKHVASGPCWCGYPTDGPHRREIPVSGELLLLAAIVAYALALLAWVV